jgi:hypothetical protein
MLRFNADPVTHIDISRDIIAHDRSAGIPFQKNILYVITHDILQNIRPSMFGAICFDKHQHITFVLYIYIYIHINTYYAQTLVSDIYIYIYISTKQKRSHQACFVYV